MTVIPEHLENAQVELIFALFGKACGLVEASVLHDHQNAEAYEGRIDHQIEQLRVAHRLFKLSDDQLAAAEWIYADAKEGIQSAKELNQVLDLIEEFSPDA